MLPDITDSRLDSRVAGQAPSPNDLCNGLSMYATYDHLPLSPGFTACQCACVVVAKKSKKQSLI
ncbi:hypothetical protein CXP40_14930 [Pseudomonas sp. YY-1]|nr:hypothetical protein CXP40_14930 [Pseudomonas sp. YY-1]